jgi:hypothetical protein
MLAEIGVPGQLSANAERRMEVDGSAVHSRLDLDILFELRHEMGYSRGDYCSVNCCFS